MKWIYRVVECRNGNGKIVFLSQRRIFFFWLKFRDFGFGTNVIESSSYKKALEVIDVHAKDILSKKRKKLKVYRAVSPIIPEHIPESQVDDYLKLKESNND